MRERPPCTATVVMLESINYFNSVIGSMPFGYYRPGQTFQPIAGLLIFWASSYEFLGIHFLTARAGWLTHLPLILIFIPNPAPQPLSIPRRVPTVVMISPINHPLGME